jgi:hypothetical protein
MTTKGRGWGGGGSTVSFILRSEPCDGLFVVLGLDVREWRAEDVSWWMSSEGPAYHEYAKIMWQEGINGGVNQQLNSAFLSLMLVLLLQPSPY